MYNINNVISVWVQYYSLNNFNYTLLEISTKYQINSKV